MKKLLSLKLLISLVAVSFSATSMAYSSVAIVSGHSPDSWYVAYGYDSQKKADKAALEGCRVSANKNGIAKLAEKCIVKSRGKGPGYGALSCGDDGCNWTAGYDERQEAINDAYDGCSKKYKNCASENLTVWEDFAGFKQVTTKSALPSSANCIPNTQARTCTSQCVNGNCVVTYSNGCKVQVQVSPKYNPFNNQWEYPSPGC
jgi:hypothetical protein